MGMGTRGGGCGSIDRGNGKGNVRNELRPYVSSDHVCMGRLLSARTEGVIGIRGRHWVCGGDAWGMGKKVDWRRHHYLTQTRVILKRAKWHSFKLAAYELCGIAFPYCGHVD